VVVTATNRDPDDVLNQLKAWCTRRLKELQSQLSVRQIRKNWWTQGGSKRRLYNEKGLEAAIRYVLEGQGDEAITDR
jgi:hypothetical protein